MYKTILLFLISLPALAADIWVDASFDGDPDGSQSAPYTSIQDGLNVVTPGDTIRILPGTYSPITSTVHGTENQKITVQAETSRTVVIAGSGRALNHERDYYIFRGIVFDGMNAGQQAVRARDFDYLELHDVEIRNGIKNCLVINRATDVLITNSEIHHCIANYTGSGNPDSHGITGDVHRLTLRDSQIYLVTGDAVQFAPGREPWDDIVVENTVFWTGPLDKAVNGWEKGQRIGENALDTKVGELGDGTGKNPDVRMTNVVAYGWRDVILNQGAFLIKEDVDVVMDRVTAYDSELGFRIRHPAHAYVSNAVVYDVLHAYRLETGPVDIRILQNSIGETEGSPFRIVDGDPVRLVGLNNLSLAELPFDDPSNIVVSPEELVDPVNGDLRPLPGSSAIDAGLPLCFIRTDRDGMTRPQNRVYDIGAYEVAWEDCGRTAPSCQ